jgi:hypothetical protein
MKTPTAAQAEVLAKLFSCEGQAISYYKGGFWSMPGQETDRNGAPPWYTMRATIAAMERNGWLRQLPTAAHYDIKAYPALADRQLTDEGREAAAFITS